MIGADNDTVFTLKSPAKINLHLRVAAPDSSGFHPLRTWMITTTLVDELIFSSGNNAGLSLSCDDPTLACDESNLVWRAAAKLMRFDSDSVAIHLKKRIPAGAGLGGGSGNAAATVVGVNQLLKLNRPLSELRDIAATLGSDVPFFLGPASAIATGRGEHLDATPPPLVARHAVLVFPPFAISTATAYRMLDSLRPVAEKGVLDAFDAQAWSRLSARELLAKLVNDLERAAFAIEPRLAELRRSIEGTLGRTVRMSGSGSTLFSLFDEAREAVAAASTIALSTGLRAVSVELGKPFGF